jgi:hemin uptake protein HemP
MTRLTCRKVRRPMNAKVTPLRKQMRTPTDQELFHGH